MKGVRRALSVAPTQKKGITTGDVKAAVTGLRPGLAGHRDRLLLTLGFAGRFRRSELATITVADIEQVAEGLLVRVERSMVAARACRGEPAHVLRFGLIP